MIAPKSKIGVLASAALAWFAAAASLEEDVAFLLEYAPPQDLPLDGAYVTNNCLLAAEARAGAPEKYPDEIYREAVLPYSVIREGVDDWRKEFRERFLPLVAGCTNGYEAAVVLDRRIWDMIGVHYSKERDMARQSPRHSMRTGKASCTGLSILLVDACRALGIPARLVGCYWVTIPGNHSWVEVWSQGRWAPVISGEKERDDGSWFLDYAAYADPLRPDRRIYASRWSPSPQGLRFWLTWDRPEGWSDVPADDVTAAYTVPRRRFAIVISPENAADAAWMDVARTLAAKHGDAKGETIIVAPPLEAARELGARRPLRVAFVMKQDEFDASSLVALKNMMRALDDDPFDDALWGIVTGPDVATARRIAASCEPSEIRRLVATTGVDDRAVPGETAVFSDAYPVGEWREKGADGAIRHGCITGDVSRIFADAWRRIDPDFLLTSAHATERNLEMPFSQGGIIATGGVFAACADVHGRGELAVLARPSAEKVWLAAGNCLIANHIAPDDMLMTALSFGRVNQFAGYIKETWFGFVGWNTWRLFAAGDHSLVESYFAACRELLEKLDKRDWKDEREKRGLEWDRDATIFYGDPMLDIFFKPRGAR